MSKLTLRHMGHGAGDTASSSDAREVKTLIGRIWHGWTSRQNADAYEELLRREVLPGIESRARGYNGIYVLRRDDGDHVEFVTLTLWESFDAIETLVGDNHEAAYVPEEARQLLHHFDGRVVHYDVVLRPEQG